MAALCIHLIKVMYKNIITNNLNAEYRVCLMYKIPTYIYLSLEYSLWMCARCEDSSSTRRLGCLPHFMWLLFAWI